MNQFRISIKVYTFFMFCFLVSNFLNAQDNEEQHKLTLSGKYKGKNVYFYNSCSDNSVSTLKRVLLNDVELKLNLSSKSIEVNLSHLQLNESVKIIIYHIKDCKPRVLNIDAIMTSDKETGMYMNK